jgi:hypothetical protein
MAYCEGGFVSGYLGQTQSQSGFQQAAYQQGMGCQTMTVTPFISGGGFSEAAFGVAPTKEKTTVFQDIKLGLHKFFNENQNLIIWIAVIFLADHFFFGGKFKEKLHGMIDKGIAKAEKKIEALQ